METKMITIPFEVELAKEIQAGTKPGKITSRGGRDARIVCWDRKAYTNYHIVALLDTPKFELVTSHTETGESDSYKEYNLMLQVPEWMQYKDGYVIYCDTTDWRGDKYIWIAVMKELMDQSQKCISIDFYFSIDIEGKNKGDTEFDGIDNCADYVRLATYEEKQQLIDALKQSTDSRAKEYLKRFFGIEKKPECEFEFLQPVLVRGYSSNQWRYGNFTHMSGGLHFVSGGIGYKYCIPYNDQTKHLLGTTDNWEAQQ